MQKLLTTREAEYILRVNNVKLIKLIRDGELPAVQLPGTRGYRISAADLEDFVRRQGAGENLKNKEAGSNV